MAAPSTEPNQVGFLVETNKSASTTSRIQPSNNVQNCTTNSNNYQRILKGNHLKQNQIQQKLPNTILTTQKMVTQKLGSKNNPNFISYHVGQRNNVGAVQTPQRLNVLQRAGKNIKIVSSYGMSHCGTASIDNDEKDFNCTHLQEVTVPTQIKISPNVSPGWLRQIVEENIVYIRFVNLT